MHQSRVPPGHQPITRRVLTGGAYGLVRGIQIASKGRVTARALSWPRRRPSIADEAVRAPSVIGPAILIPRPEDAGHLARRMFQE